MSPLQTVIDEALKWAVPAVCGTFLTLVTIRHRAIMNWRRKRETTRKALEAMAEAFPTLTLQAGRLTEEFQAIHASQADVKEMVGDLLALGYGNFELSPTATFVCDNAGRNMMVNSAYARMLHTGRDELMEYGYRRFIAPSEVAVYLAGFKVAAEEHREFDSNVCLIRADGSEVRVHIRMVPHPRQKGPATHWIGTIGLIEGEC